MQAEAAKGFRLQHISIALCHASHVHASPTRRRVCPRTLLLARHVVSCHALNAGARRPSGRLAMQHLSVRLSRHAILYPACNKFVLGHKHMWHPLPMAPHPLASTN
jgi:hypothetical protein